jgi:hypothetical protein
MENAAGIGTVTSEMVEARARELSDEREIAADPIPVRRVRLSRRAQRA